MRIRPGDGAKGHAQADLARPLRDHVRQHAVQPDRDEQRREPGECGRERRDEPVEHDVLADLLAERPQIVERQVGIEARHERRQRARHLLGITRRPNVERDRSQPVVLTVRREEQRRNLVLDLAVLRVLHEPDDLDVELAGVPLLHALADRITPEVELPGELFVHDRDFGRALTDPIA